MEASKGQHFLAIADKSQMQLPVKPARHSAQRSDRIRAPLNEPLKKSPPGANARSQGLPNSRRLPLNSQNRIEDCERLFG